MTARSSAALMNAALLMLTTASASGAEQASWARAMVALRQQQLEQSCAAATNDGRAAASERATESSERLAAALRHFWQQYPEMDWFLQDQPQRVEMSDGIDVARDFGWYFHARPSAEREAAMIQRVLEELGDEHVEFRRRLQELLAAERGPEDAAWLELYVAACRQRRAQRLQSLAQRVPRIVFVKHYTMGGSHYAYTEGQSDAQAERHFVPGAELALLVWDGGQYREETLLRDEEGVIRDPDVSYDGRRILFSWKKSDREDDYHLYEMDLDTRAIRQLTFGLGVADYEGAYLPDGDIIFNSTRCVQIVDCWWTEVSNLYRCDGDGNLLRRLTFDQVHDNFPTVTRDGRILYTRWEYNDRGQIYPQPLLQMNSDGTNQSDFYAGNSWFPTTILHARAIPGGNKVLAIATGHHSRQTGKLIEINPSRGRQENQGVLLVGPPRATPSVRVDAYGQEGELFQYPYPLNEEEYLVTYHPVGWSWARDAWGPLFGIYYFTRDGRRERLVSDPLWPCSQSIPLLARPAGHVRPSEVDYRRTTGTCYIQDVYAGPGLAGIPRGTVRRLRVIALDFRAAGIGSNENGGPGGGALISTPIAIGNGAWDPKIILGEASVRADGSAFFEIPARRPVYFQLLDERGQMVQTMRSWTTLQPGENASCVGCHEHKNSVPLVARTFTEALQAGCETLRPWDASPRGFSFPRDVQPILSRHCVRCHADRDIPYELTDRIVHDPAAKRHWSAAYLQLTHARRDGADASGPWRGDPDHTLVNWVSAQSVPTMLPPRSGGAATSELLQLLDAGHEGVQLSRDELETIAAWIDLGVPFCGDYVEAHAWSADELAKYRHFEQKRQRLADAERESLTRWLDSQPRGQ